MKVRVPASIANLGPGFDVLAMAIDLWLEAEAVDSETPRWEFEGEMPDGGKFGLFAGAAPGGVGLGSSAAANVASLALSGVEGADLLSRAAEAEGHPDNAAAAIHGGVVAVVNGRVHHLPAPDLEVALFVSAQVQPTEQARAVLPDRVSRADAVYNAAGLGLLVHALHLRDWGLLAEALDDRLHQPYRLSLYPWAGNALRAASEAGAYGSAIAGAGPSVFAFCAPGRGTQVAAAMADAARVNGRPLVTNVIAGGVEISR